MSRARSPSKIAAARIPKITDLREQLAYGDGRLARCAAFIDDLRVFRRRFSFGGLRGIDFWDWKSSQHHEALKQMTTCFLDEDGYGEVYWPSDPTAANFNSLRYSTDRVFITQTMRELIFRMNLQQYRNEKYKKKEPQPAHEVIVLEDDDPVLSPDRSENSAKTPSISPATTATTQTYADVRNEGTRVPLTVSDSLQQERDIYDVPEDIGEQPSTTKRKLKAPSKINNHKRSKIVSLKIGAGKPSNFYRRPIAPMPKRTSPRRVKTVPRVNYADTPDLDQSFPSPASAMESTLGRDSVTRAAHQDQANDRQQSENDGVLFNYTRNSQPSLTNESTPPIPTNVPRGMIVDPNIDPNLERTSSPASSMNPPTHQALTHSRPSWPNSPPPLTHVDTSSSIQPEVEDAPSPAWTISTIGSMHGTNKTSVSLFPSSVPSDAEKPAEQVTAALPATISRPVATSSTESKAGIFFNYRVILSRTPIYQAKSWQPRGHFLEKSLSELIDELPFENKEGILELIIQLTGPGVAVEWTVERGENATDNYNSAKAEFMQIVKMCLKTHVKANTGSRLVMNFKIEAVREGGVDEDEDDDDDVLLF